MIDTVLLLALLAAAGAAGLVTLRALGAAAGTPGERLVEGLAVGLGIAGMVGLVLAATGMLRPTPIALVGVLMLAVGGGDLARAVRALEPGAARRAWPYLVVCAVVLAVEIAPMLAPPIGGDQTKYQLAYPRLYAQHHGLVETPWSFWGQMQFLPNFVFALGFALGTDALPRLVNGTFGVLAALALAALVRRSFGFRSGAAAGALFFSLPITWSIMTRAGADLALVLYTALAATAFVVWHTDGRASDLRRAALFAGLAGGSKVMGLLVPALLGAGVLATLAWRALPVRRMVGAATAFGVIALVAAAPCYVRNGVDTGNPLFPFGYGVFGGRHWSGPASDYLADYYRQYQTDQAVHRDGTPYVGLDVVRFPWDLTMHPDSFENGARQAMDVSPFALAFVPGLLVVRRRRSAVLLTAGLGIAYAGIIAGGAWAHPRYVLPGVALLLVSALPAARAVLPRRVFALVVALTVVGNLALSTRLLRPLWPDQVRVALGRLDENEFLRRHSPRFVFWEQANGEVPAGGLVLVLEKIPHPYYIERPFVLASYLEQGLIDYRSIKTADELATVAHDLGVTHVAVDLAGLNAGSDPFEASVARLWRAFLADECEEPIVRGGGYALYALHAETGPTALARRSGHADLSARSARAPQVVATSDGEADRESGRAGRRGLGASEERSARSARAPDGPPGSNA
jgi:hypothetical protein